MGPWLAAVVVVLTAAAYTQTVNFDFVYDDHLQIVNSPAVHSWSFLPRYFTTHVWQFSKPGLPPTYYRPLFLLWLLVNYTLFGLDPAWWHLTTMAAHLLSTLMVYLLARRLTGDPAVSAFASLIFGLHPAHIEAVAWISGVTEPLCAVLIISSFLCYLHWRERQTGAGKSLLAWRALSLLLYLCALLEKETAVVFPAIIFGYEWIFQPPTKGPPRRAGLALARVAPYLVLATVYLAVRSAVLGGLRVGATPLSWPTMILTLPSVLLFYLKRLIWPVGLSPFYDMPYVTSGDASRFLVPALLLTLAAVLLWVWSIRSRVAAFASIWLLAPLLPVLNLRAFGQEELVHDRYLYLPSVGVALLAALALRRFKTGRFDLPGKAVPQALSVAGLAALLAFGTWVQSRYWDNELDLFRRGVAVAPDNTLAKHSLAVQLGSLGVYSEAIPLLVDVLQRKPQSFESNVALGRYYYSVGSFAEAEVYLSRALNIQPHLTRIPYAYLGLARMEQGRLDAAESAIRAGMQIVPLDADGRLIHGALGAVLERKGELQPALAEFKLELARNPASGEAREEIAKVEARLRGNGAHLEKSSSPPAAQ